MSGPGRCAALPGHSGCWVLSSRWRMSALGRTIDERTVAADLASMPLPEWRRAFANQWADEVDDSGWAVIPKMWALAVDPHSPAASLIKPLTGPLRNAGVKLLEPTSAAPPCGTGGPHGVARRTASAHHASHRTGHTFGVVGRRHGLPASHTSKCAHWASNRPGPQDPSPVGSSSGSGVLCSRSVRVRVLARSARSADMRSVGWGPAHHD